MEHVRIYRTGDLARRLGDGNIEFFGRIDHQVKIRGYRIELGEIESRLLAHEGIKEAVVLAPDRGGEKYLCAYVVAGCGDVGLDTAALQDYLSELLPGYMIPTYFVFPDKMPLTANRKIDRKALLLLAPDVMDRAAETYAAPGDKLERQLVEIWADVLVI
ncbi:MAG: amino acid adenylation domain-containing protein, partial [bacterium]|nr:amino acid adenylation domain-containing protein [bacterium]